MTNFDSAPLRPELPPLPARFTKLPTHRGFPVPWFVAVIDGVPDFRVIGPDKIPLAHNRRLCWLCGQRLGSYLTFVVGPMCAVNRISSEPPSHTECAEFAAVACPFLSRPHMVRREGRMPDGVDPPAGVGLKRNPGVTLLWTTRSYTVRRVAAHEANPGVLFEMGDPLKVQCFAEGRTATRAEIRASIESGLPLLTAGAPPMGEIERYRSEKEIERRTEEALQLLGAAAA